MSWQSTPSGERWIERDDDDSPPRCEVIGCKQPAVAVITAVSRVEKWEVFSRRVCEEHGAAAANALGLSAEEQDWRDRPDDDDDPPPADYPCEIDF